MQILRNYWDQWDSWKELGRLVLELWFSVGCLGNVFGLSHLFLVKLGCRAESARWQPRVMPGARHRHG